MFDGGRWVNHDRRLHVVLGNEFQGAVQVPARLVVHADPICPGFRKIGNELVGILDWISDAQFPKEAAGKAYIPSVAAMKACDRLFHALRKRGVFVLEVGQLERFVPSEGSHGPSWVNTVLKKNLLTDGELQSAREFVKLLFS